MAKRRLHNLKLAVHKSPAKLYPGPFRQDAALQDRFTSDLEDVARLTEQLHSATVLPFNRLINWE